jgi:hypothetical protein
MEVDPSILVTLLNPLEADGLVSRDRDPADRRRHVVTLKPVGKRQLDRSAKAQREAEDALFAALSPKQREQLRTLPITLRDSQAPSTTNTPPPRVAGPVLSGSRLSRIPMRAVPSAASRIHGEGTLLAGTRRSPCTCNATNTERVL